MYCSFRDVPRLCGTLDVGVFIQKMFYVGGNKWLMSTLQIMHAFQVEPTTIQPRETLYDLHCKTQCLKLRWKYKVWLFTLNITRVSTRRMIFSSIERSWWLHYKFCLIVSLGSTTACTWGRMSDLAGKEMFKSTFFKEIWEGVIPEAWILHEWKGLGEHIMKNV